ncbi:hypothetical protein MMC10_010723 [Thelotrema lepadinum]|nr:hypothetical protein [Thelotrema lepadinum]
MKFEYLERDDRSLGRNVVSNSPLYEVNALRHPPAASTSALFRKSPSSKKHTRPPMAKLFSSLELSPENFLQLQSAAKTYMLDDTHPDRRETVGIRGKGDSELVKLRLLNCVKDFLEGRGNGLKFFGPDVTGEEDGRQRTMIWPRDKNKIINAVTPLLRRIITNERQRQYALETRGKEHVADQQSPKTAKDMAVPAMEDAEDDSQDLMPFRASGLFFNEITKSNIKDYRHWRELADPETLSKLANLFGNTGLPKEDFVDLIATFHYHLRKEHSTNGSGTVVCSRPCERALVEKIINSGLWENGHWMCDPQLNLCDKSAFARRELYKLFALIRSALGHHIPPMDVPMETTLEFDAESKLRCHKNRHSMRFDHLPISGPRLTLRISLIRNGFNAVPRREVPSDLCPYLHSVAQKATETLGLANTEKCEVRAHLPDGLKLIISDEAWASAIKEASQVEWMHHELSVIVDLRA